MKSGTIDKGRNCGCYYICAHVTKRGDPKNSEMRAEMKPDPDSLGAHTAGDGLCIPRKQG